MKRKTAKKKSKVIKRAPGMTQISISIPQKVVDDIDKIAALENRNRSNFIATSLEKLCEKKSK